MKLLSVLKGGIIFLVGVFVGFQLAIVHISYSPATVPIIPNIPNYPLSQDLQYKNEKEDIYKKMNDEFMNLYPNPCMPMGNDEVACLPNFIILGAMKAGTTFIDHYLQEHPRVAKHPQKEMFFFSQQHGKGIQWYANHFQNLTIGDGKMIGEATPVYLGWPLAPQRVRITVPNAKLIVSLRDPVERAYSQYFHSIRWLKSQEGSQLWQSFEQLLEEEIRMMKYCGLYPGAEFPTFIPDLKEEYATFYSECYENCGNCFPYKNSLHGHGNPAFGLLAKSLYFYQIENWFKIIPRDQFLFVKYEDLGSNSETVMSSILEFLHLEPIYEYGILNPKNVNKHPEMNPDTRKKLNIFFREHTLKLYNLLDSTNIYKDWESMKT